MRKKKQQDKVKKKKTKRLSKVSLKGRKQNLTDSRIQVTVGGIKYKEETKRVASKGGASGDNPKRRKECE